MTMATIGIWVVATQQWKEMRLDQRAWVGPVAVYGTQFSEGNNKTFVKEGEKAAVGVEIINSGKTIAKGFESCVTRKAIPAGDKLDTSCPEGGPRSVSVLLPGARLQAASPETGIATAKDVEELRNGSRMFYLFGRLTYEDAFGQPHFTTFCMYLTTDLSSFNSCPFYNDAN
jgi:hypothetical protein